MNYSLPKVRPHTYRPYLPTPLNNHALAIARLNLSCENWINKRNRQTGRSVSDLIGTVIAIA